MAVRLSDAGRFREAVRVGEAVRAARRLTVFACGVASILTLAGKRRFLFGTFFTGAAGLEGWLRPILVASVPSAVPNVTAAEFRILGSAFLSMATLFHRVVIGPFSGV